MKKGEATRERILEVAGRQAAVRGFAAVSLSDVAEAVGLSKSGLFKHFDSKEAMQLAALAYATERFTAYVWEPVAHLPSGRERLEAIFARWIDWGEQENAAGGCPIMAASVELDDQPGALRDHVQRQSQRWQKTLAREMQALRTPPVDEEDARTAAFQMKSFVLGYADARRLLEEAGARKAAQAAFKALLDRTAAG